MNVDEKTFENVDMDKYSKDYSEEGMWDKAKKNFKYVGVKALYQALQLFYLAQSPNCPPKIKAAILATLGYFISPFDLIPDITPALGFSDDIVAISVSLAMAQAYIDDDIKDRAKAKIADIFGKEAIEKLEA